MIPMTLAEIADVVGGTLAGISRQAAEQLTVTGPVVADSRQAAPGGLFLADAAGHDFASDALTRGAVAALGSREVPGVPMVVAPEPSDTGPDRDRSVLALGQLARHLMARLDNTSVIAVTGSSGKTSTKDLLGQVLAHAGSTIAPEASLNDELGVPLTVLRADESTRFLVLEMGARGIGHLAYLTKLIRPAVGVVLNVGTAHVGEFGGKDGIAKAKGELVESLPAAGFAVLNADDPLVRAMAGRTAARVVLAGEAADAQVRADDVTLDAAGRPAFRLVANGASADVRLQLVGRHHVSNALAVAAVALVAGGMTVDAVADGLSAARRGSRWRMEVTERSDGVTVVNDAYNANPDSMRAALHAVHTLAGGRRTWAVLGEMLELGAGSAAEHEAIGRLAAELGFDRVVAVGDGARAIGEGAGTGASYVRDSDAAAALLRSELRRHDVVLVKSSRDAGLRYLGDALVADREESGG